MINGPYDLTETIETLKIVRGNIAEAARQLGRSRRSLKDYIDRTPECMDILDELRESALDKAEQNYMIAVEAGDLPASKFILLTLGRGRGYSTRVEHTGEGGGNLIVEIVRYTDDIVEPQAHE